MVFSWGDGELCAGAKGWGTFQENLMVYMTTQYTSITGQNEMNSDATVTPRNSNIFSIWKNLARFSGVYLTLPGHEIDRIAGMPCGLRVDCSYTKDWPPSR